MEFKEESPQVARLLKDISRGKYNVYNDPKTENFLREKLRVYQDLRRKHLGDLKKEAFKQLRLKEYFS